MKVLVEISRNKQKFYIIVVDHNQQKDYVVELTEKLAQKYVLECGNNFERLISRLYFKFGRLQMTDVNRLQYV
jgi:hypothetical protein